ncbi:hypothetical protein [Haloarchaeobius sp. HRN-SO-5]|uniref:hypothetical protein n=1 Tax=Haloarchaeobius sp. HRN-SO-5 TaxID=3446118 RepID=UPI003EBAD5D2
MRLRNRRGTPVDPVPFFVVCASAVFVFFSFGPVYLVTLNVPLDAAICLCAVVWTGFVVASYHRLVWDSNPEHRAVVPPARRIQRLFYAVLTGMALLALLSLPLVLG